MFNYLEARFDYGYWRVEICFKSGYGEAIHERLVVALWRALRRATSSRAKR